MGTADRDDCKAQNAAIAVAIASICNAADRLKEKVSLTATVIRDGQRQEIQASALVQGDIILLAAGNLVPADGTLLQACNLYVNEALLTGESFPAEKHAAPDPGSPAAGSRFALPSPCPRRG